MGEKLLLEVTKATKDCSAALYDCLHHQQTNRGSGLSWGFCVLLDDESANYIICERGDKRKIFDGKDPSK